MVAPDSFGFAPIVDIDDAAGHEGRDARTESMRTAMCHERNTCDHMDWSKQVAKPNDNLARAVRIPQKC